ncbi:hypothetical protein, partial [Brevibacillus borstelensis]|uniref:hypothetical protein n=1 Tax=Brevibacillus borstelensis TaxID=45462 RepID=UPI00203B5789
VTSLLWGLWFGHRKTSPGRGEVLFLCSENLVAQGFRFMQKAHNTYVGCAGGMLKACMQT